MTKSELILQSAIDEWLAKGNKITQCAIGESGTNDVVGYTHNWGRKKKEAADDKINQSKEK